MTRVVADISMSLDGYVAGPNVSLSNGLGDGGEALHDWAASADPVDAEVLRSGTESSGAVVMGRNLFDIVDGPHGWNDEMGYGAGFAASPPFFVVTHEPPAHVRLDLDFTFVTEGPAAAVERARHVAGDKDVVVMGGGDLVAQCVALGLVDEVRLHLAPVVLGGGVRLFPPGLQRRFAQQAVLPSTTATHVTYVALD